MSKYFGTDGIRGQVGERLTPEFILQIGIAAGHVLQNEGIEKICIGQDTRISSDFILSILMGGLLSGGVDVVNLGTISTPVISYTITENKNIQAGVMISASHNPYYDNGIKFFGSDGKKISAVIEGKIEDSIGKKYKIDNKQIGQMIHDEELIHNYSEFLVDAGVNLKGKKIGLDLANGSATAIVPHLFVNLGATVEIIGNDPDGYNINKNIGSTHPEQLQELVKSKKLDYGFAYDGDADRVQLIDNSGTLLDGDYIIYLIAKYLKEKKQLKNNQVVSTVMSNIGFKKAIKKLGIENVETQVGDKYVMRMIDEIGASVGGEQSGHIIIPSFITTGDGILTSVFLSKIIEEKNIDFMELKKEMKKYPQVLENYKCSADEKKDIIMSNKELLKFIEDYNDTIKSSGRILLRASGTEKLIRVMVEMPDVNECRRIIDEVIEKLKSI